MADTAKSSTDNTPDSGVVVELSSRLVYSLLKAAVRVAARCNMPMQRLTQLAQNAYFEELRKGAPRDLAGIADRLGVSLRTVASLNKRLKSPFFAPESEVEPVRRITALLLRGPRDFAGITSVVDDDPVEVRRGLNLLMENRWVREEDGVFTLIEDMRSFVSEELSRRIDGLNNQMEILAESVWQRFIDHNDQTARGRSWAFAARAEEMERFIERSVSDMRHAAIDMEELAVSDGVFQRYGVTIAVAPLEDESQ